MALYKRRNDAGLCAHDNRDQGGVPHGKPTHGKVVKICDGCHDDQRARKAASREARRAAG